MEKMRTLAFQVPEDLFEKIKEYLHRNNLSQRRFMMGLIERELERETTKSKCVKAEQEKVGSEEKSEKISKPLKVESQETAKLESLEKVALESEKPEPDETEREALYGEESEVQRRNGK